MGEEIDGIRKGCASDAKRHIEALFRAKVALSPPDPMPLRSSPTAPPRYDNTVQRRPDPKHVFDRDPILIPQLFVDPSPPWYKRPRWLALVVVSAGAVVTVGVLTAVQGPRGAIDTLGRVGVGAMHVYTRLVAGGHPG